MSSIDRWTVKHESHESPWTEKDAAGAWVKYLDVKALRASHAQLLEAVTALVETSVDGWDDSFDAARAAIKSADQL